MEDEVKVMHFFKFLLLTPVVLWLSCILEPYERIEEIGVCYQGSDEYEMLMKNEGEYFALRSMCPDTIRIDSSEQKINLAYVCQIDTAFFNDGKYELTSLYLSSSGHELPYRFNWFGIMFEVEMDSTGIYKTDRFDDVKIKYEIINQVLGSVADTVNLLLYCSVDTQFVPSPDTELPSTDTLILKLSCFLHRSVNNCSCSSEFITSTDSVIVLIRRPFE